VHVVHDGAAWGIAGADPGAVWTRAGHSVECHAGGPVAGAASWAVADRDRCDRGAAAAELGLGAGGHDDGAGGCDGGFLSRRSLWTCGGGPAVGRFWRA